MCDIWRDLFVFTLYLTWCLDSAHSYLVRNHPCCQDPADNITLAMIIDAFEIYGHDPTDKLDHLAHYQIQMMKIKRAPDQYIINEHVHIATDHLSRFIYMHIKELKVLLIALDDTIDNMLTMYDNHNAIKTERVATYNSPTGGAVPSEFYLSQEFYCGKNVYIFVSDLYSDIYNMGRGYTPFCKGRAFHFLGFVHYLEDTKYFLEEDPNVVFQMDNYIHGLECHRGICIFRFPFKKNLQHVRDVSAMPKAIVKCGTIMYKLPPLTAASCIITSGSFILDFNIEGLRFRHYDYLLHLPNGYAYYTKEPHTPLVCDHHVCEWNFTNFYGGPFIVPGDPGRGVSPIPPYVEATTQEPYWSTATPPVDPNITYSLDGCWYMFPPNYGSIAGISYLDPLSVNEYRFSCQGNGNKGLYWYPQWMGAPPHHPYPQSNDNPLQMPQGDRSPYYPHQQITPNMEPYWSTATPPVDPNITYSLDGCWYMFPPNYGSIAGISYLDPLSVNEYRFSCQGNGNKGLYWYPQWMGAPPHHPYPQSNDNPLQMPQGDRSPYYPHQQITPNMVNPPLPSY